MPKKGKSGLRVSSLAKQHLFVILLYIFLSLLSIAKKQKKFIELNFKKALTILTAVV